MAVEFAFLAAILMAFIAAGIDLINISAFNREIERSTTQIAAAITSCPASSTPGYVSCTTDTIQQYTDRKANMLVRFQGMMTAGQFQLQIVQVYETSGTLKVCAGTSTALDADIVTRALAVLNDKDIAIVVVMSATYVPFLPKISTVLTGSAANSLRGYTIAVQAGNIATFC